MDRPRLFSRCSRGTRYARRTIEHFEDRLGLIERRSVNNSLGSAISRGRCRESVSSSCHRCARCKRFRAALRFCRSRRQHPAAMSRVTLAGIFRERSTCAATSLPGYEVVFRLLDGRRRRPEYCLFAYSGKANDAS